MNSLADTLPFISSRCCFTSMTVAAYMAERNIDTLDAGVPVLSMHSPFETVGKLDCYMTYKGMKAVFEAC